MKRKFQDILKSQAEKMHVAEVPSEDALVQATGYGKTKPGFNPGDRVKNTNTNIRYPYGIFFRYLTDTEKAVASYNSTGNPVNFDDCLVIAAVNSVDGEPLVFLSCSWSLVPAQEEEEVTEDKSDEDGGSSQDGFIAALQKMWESK